MSQSDQVPASVTAAREILQAAHDNLDRGLAALPQRGYDNAMVTPALLALLVRFVDARRQVDGLELALAQTRAT